MSHLLDVNVLIAWGWSDHPHHDRVDKWIRAVTSQRGGLLHTTSIAEIGFVRISVQKSLETVSVHEAAERLDHLLTKLGTHHRFLPDDLSSRRDFPAWCKSYKHTTDSHLLALAEKHGVQLATLDTGIPGAFIIPE
jgi:toxin-antitoxin system PIN domain toxin